VTQTLKNIPQRAGMTLEESRLPVPPPFPDEPVIADFNDLGLGTGVYMCMDKMEAYGPVNPEMRQSVPREGIPADIPLDPGTQLQMQTPEGQALPVTVVEVDETTVTLDANHPLAGKDLQFDIELVKIA
jgi:FKBP-type peptidyl-prolyl cis-trans isomerase 2